MMQRRQVVLLLLCGAVLILLAAEMVHAARVDVFLLGGQSNMQGVGNTRELSSTLQGPQEDVLFYFGSSLTTLRPGSGVDFGPEISFGRALADTFPAETFALIKYAVGGTNLEHDWAPNTRSNTYSKFRETVTAGLARLREAGHSPHITGMLWTQGERDVVIGTTAQYEANLNEFISDARARYGANMPIFVSQLSSGQTNLINRASEAALNEVRAAQASVAAGDPDTYLITTDTFALKSDKLHFNAAGQIALGRAFAEAYVQLIPEPGSLVQLAIGLLGIMLYR